jgi:uncharacterized membrane protein YadS
VGAAARYGSVALVVGTKVKLARAFWIVPLSLAAAALKLTNGAIRYPWFILLFCVAVAANTYFPALANLWQQPYNLGKLGLTASLFVIGTGISRGAIHQVGIRPLLQGLILFFLVAVTSLWLITTGVIALE